MLHHRCTLPAIVESIVCPLDLEKFKTRGHILYNQQIIRYFGLLGVNTDVENQGKVFRQVRLEIKQECLWPSKGADTYEEGHSTATSKCKTLEQKLML